MPIHRRGAIAALACSLALLSAPVLGQPGYPAKPVRIIVPFPPGQAADTFSRMLAERLSALWGQQVVVENRGGGGGVPGVMAVKDAPPDGYTWLVGTSGTLGVNPSVYAKIPYDPLKDFAPASNIFIVPLIIVAHPSFAPNTVAELVEAAKKAPGRINFASAGPGTAQHMTGELFKLRAGIDLVHIPYKGSGPGITDLVGGQVPIMFDSVTSALPHIKSGRAKAIAVTTAQRIAQLPDVPTVAESGYPGFEGVGWSGIVLPAGTPREIVERVSADIQKLLNDPQLRERMLDRGGIPDPRTPQGYADFLRSEIEKWAQVAKAANVRLDQ
jgi:tripartite-type tricarboxylate transporter receptor subunit TctC